jgi:hypothetical protein
MYGEEVQGVNINAENGRGKLLSIGPKPFRGE